MGLGKTVQVLSLLASRASKKRSIIVCPASVIPVWLGEIARFQPGMKTAVLTADSDFANNPDADIWISSYTQLRRHAALLDKTEFGYAVLDEAQAIKNPDSKTTQVCLAMNAEHRIAVTGTPLENRPTDVWTIFRFLMPGLLGKRAAFEKMVQRDVSTALVKVRRQVSPFILRRLKRDVAADIPPKMEVILPCPLTQEQRELYAAYASKSGLSGDLSAHLAHALAPSLLRSRSLARQRQRAPRALLKDWHPPLETHRSHRQRIQGRRLLAIRLPPRARQTRPRARLASRAHLRINRRNQRPRHTRRIL
jgi:SNF2 family DNA or RNA helicase